MRIIVPLISVVGWTLVVMVCILGLVEAVIEDWICWAVAFALFGMFGASMAICELAERKVGRL